MRWGIGGAHPGGAHPGGAHSGEALSALIAAQTHQPAPIALVGAALRPRPRQLRQLLLFLEMRAPSGALRSLQIVRLRLGGGAAALGQPQHLEFGDDPLQGQTEPVADADAVSGLDALGVQMHLAAVDGGGGQGTGFVKSGVPEPFVQTGAFRPVVRPHVCTIAFPLRCPAV
jgi:hypothetical protein